MVRFAQVPEQFAHGAQIIVSVAQKVMDFSQVLVQPNV